jgi:photosystem II stability/assembly factor-like uncharacterized protein
VNCLRRIIVPGLALGLLAACGDTGTGSRVDTDETPDVETNDTPDVEDTLADAALDADSHDADTDIDSADLGSADARDAEPDAAEEVRDTLDTFDALDTSDASEVDTSPPVCPWEPWNEGLVGGRVSAAAFDPRTPGTAWSFSGGVLFRSVDHGMLWDIVNHEIGASYIAFPPGRPKELIAGSADGLWTTRNSGQTFERLALGGLEVTSLLIDPALPERIFVGLHSLGVLRSDDRGQTWSPRNVGIGQVRVSSLAGFADTPDLLLAGTVLLNDALGATGEGQILRTTDGGRSWSIVSTDSRWTTDIEVCPSDPSHVIAATRRGMRVSHDRGLTWQPIPGLAGRDIIDVVFDPTRCTTYWAVAYQNGVYRVDDDGATITGPLVSGLDVQVTALDATISVHPARPGTLLLGTHGGLFKSENRGTSWRRLDAARGLQISDVATSASEPSRVFLSTWGGGLWTRTSNSPWARVASLDADFQFSVNTDPVAPGRMIVGGWGTNWLTQGGLEAFRRFGAVGSPPRNILAAAFVEPLPGSDASRALLVASQVDGVVRSDDDGQSWHPQNNGLSPWLTSAGTFVDIRAILVDRDDPRRVYGGTRGRGVVVSDDGGQTWAFGDNALANEIVPRLVTGDDGDIFAMVEGRGVYHSTDRGETWNEPNGGLGALELRDLVRDPLSGDLFLAVARSPLLRSQNGGLTWAPLERWCQDAEDFNAIELLTDEVGRRWLVGAKSGNVILRIRLD